MESQSLARIFAPPKNEINGSFLSVGFETKNIVGFVQAASQYFYISAPCRVGPNNQNAGSSTSGPKSKRTTLKFQVSGKMLLFILAGLVTLTAIWVSKREALIGIIAAISGSFLLGALGLEGKAASYLYSTYLAIIGIFMALRFCFKINRGKENISMSHSSESYAFTPLDHEANDPRLLSKHSIDGPNPRKMES